MPLPDTLQGQQAQIPPKQKPGDPPRGSDIAAQGQDPAKAGQATSAAPTAGAVPAQAATSLGLGPADVQVAKAPPAASPPALPPGIAAALGLGPGDVQVARGPVVPGEVQGAVTQSAADQMGLGPADVQILPEPAVPTQPNPVQVAQEQVKQVAKAAEELPNVGAQAAIAETQQPNTLDLPQGEPDPVKASTKEPGFWDKLLEVSKTAGRTIFELLGDFAAGYSHQQSSPTEQRLAREQELRLQGSAAQAQKDLASMQQGFQSRQADLDRELQTKLAAATNANQQQQLRQEYEIQKERNRAELLQAQNTYSLQVLMQQLSAGQTTANVGSFENTVKRYAGVQ